MKTSNDTFKRTEMKYVITKTQKENILRGISEYISPDVHKAYTICNIYCDTPNDRLIRTSIDKPVYKEKIRSRSYGKVNKDDKVFLELKKKYEGIVYKRRIAIKQSESEMYFNGKGLYDNQINKEIDYFFRYYKDVKPKMYIAYDREAYFAKEDESLRITFDTNILWRTTDLDLKSEVYGNSLLEKDTFVLEIKCSNAMPLWLVSVLSENHAYKGSFSKYGNAYKVSLMNKENIGGYTNV